MRKQHKRNAKKRKDYKASPEGKVDLVDTSFAYLTDIAMYKGIDEDEKGFVLLAVTNPDPIHYSAAMNTKDKIHWQKAIDYEFQCIHEN